MYAPGCPVMVIGTHNDIANEKEVHIKRDINYMYSDYCSFPKIADVCLVSNIQGSMKPLRNRIYSVAIRLHYNGRNQC